MCIEETFVNKTNAVLGMSDSLSFCLSPNRNPNLRLRQWLRIRTPRLDANSIFINQPISKIILLMCIYVLDVSIDAALHVYSSSVSAPGGFKPRYPLKKTLKQHNSFIKKN